MERYWKKLRSLEKASVVMAGVLLICLLPLPYGFYTIIRFAVAILAGCWAYYFYVRKNITLAIISCAILLIFQPFLKITMDRLTWNILDVAIAFSLLMLVASRFRAKKKIRKASYKR